MEVTRNLSQGREVCGQIFEPADDQMRHAVLPLQKARGQKSQGVPSYPAIALPNVRPDNQIGRAGFVFERDKRGSLGGSRPLAHKHQPADAVTLVGRNRQ